MIRSYLSWNSQMLRSLFPHGGIPNGEELISKLRDPQRERSYHICNESFHNPKDLLLSSGDRRMLNSCPRHQGIL